MKTKLLWKVMAVCIMALIALGFAWFGALQVSANADTDTSGLSFTLINDGNEYKVSASNKNLTSAIIPAEYNGLPVTEIADNGFMMCRSLERIMVPSSVIKVGNNAFMNDTRLKRVMGMSGVTSYGNNAFSMCSALEYLILPSGITQLGTSVVKNITSTIYARASETEMKELNPNWNYNGNIIYGNSIAFADYTSPDGEQGYEVVGWQNLEPSTEPLVLYSWCYKDENDDIGAKLLNIQAGAFYNFNVPSITIKHPENSGLSHAINIEPYAFTYTNIDSITIETSITFNANDSGYADGDCVFYSSSAKTITLLDSLKTISKQMFLDCKNLESINYSSTNTHNYLIDVVNIEQEAFSGCINLTTLEIPDTIKYIGENAFLNWGTNFKKQCIFINAKEEIVNDNNWDSLWDNGIDLEYCEIEFISGIDLAVNFVVHQEGVIGATEINSISVERNSTLKDVGLTSPSSTSHDFTGWYTTESRSEGTEFNLDTPIKRNITLYAGWQIKSFNITFLQNKYCSYFDFETKQCLDSETLICTYCENFNFYLETKIGYENYRVYSNDNVLNAVSGNVYTITVTEDCSLSVEADLTVYTITYENVRKGINPNKNITTYTIESDTIVFADPVWEAYESATWDIKSIPQNSHENKTIKAVWIDAKTFTVDFNLGGDPNAKNSNGDSISYTVEDAIILVPPVSPGYDSGSWDINSWQPDTRWRNFTVNAIWSNGKPYNIYFDLNGGTGDSSSVTVNYGDYLPSKTSPSLDGSIFLGYYSLLDNEQYYNADMRAIRRWYTPQDGKLQANWRLEHEYYYITFVQYDGTGIGVPESPMKVEYNKPWPTISMPTRRGYTFDGYYYRYDMPNRKIYNSDGTYNPDNIEFGSTYDVRYNITLHGRWVVADYYNFRIDKWHYMADSGELIDSLFVPIDDSYEFTAPETYTYVEYTEDGRNIIREDIKGFTAWRMNLNGPDGYDSTTNPWIELTNDRYLKFNVVDIIDNYYPNYSIASATIYIRAVYLESTGGSCLAENTQITLADGTQKAIQDLTGEENLLVWNLFTGTFDVAPILFIDRDPAKMYEVINLYFSDGTEVKVISEHAFWDFNLNEYVYLRNDAAKYIGHWFNKQIIDENNNLSYTKVQLVNVIVKEEMTSAWSPVTYGHLCYYVNGMLSMPGAIEGFINIFEVDSETLRVNEVAMQNDIEEYGLFTYEEFAEIYPITEEIFNAFGGQYLKISIGKGLIDMERIGKLINRYAEFLS